MIVEDKPLEGVKIVTATVHEDDRGHFFVSYNDAEMAKHVGTPPFVQDNISFSKRGVLRGLHYQTVHPQGKLVRAISGEIFDVAVDIRVNSPTRGQYVGVVLSASNKLALWVPPGFAHGFLTISDSAEVLYKVTDYWDPASERTLRYDDPSVAVNWPELASSDLILSPKDADGLYFEDAIQELKDLGV